MRGSTILHGWVSTVVAIGNNDEPKAWGWETTSGFDDTTKYRKFYDLKLSVIENEKASKLNHTFLTHFVQNGVLPSAIDFLRQKVSNLENN